MQLNCIKGLIYLFQFSNNLVYVLGYFSFYIIRNGSLTDINYTFWSLFHQWFIDSFCTAADLFLRESLLAVSNVSLLELSDTNSGVFKNCLIKHLGHSITPYR